MAKLNGILFFVDLILGFYFINLGSTPNFVTLAFLDPIKNWIEIGGGALLILSGLMTIGRRTKQ